MGRFRIALFVRQECHCFGILRNGINMPFSDLSSAKVPPGRTQAGHDVAWVAVLSPGAADDAVLATALSRARARDVR